VDGENELSRLTVLFFVRVVIMGWTKEVD